jgi:hypothetical protein
LPPPTSGEQTSPTALSGDFSGKKKKIRPLGVAAIHPYGQGERDPATPSGHFVSGEPKKKIRRTQKKNPA